MRYSVILFFMVILSTHFAMSQNDSITARDTIELTYQIKSNIFPQYKNLLTLLTSTDVLQSEVDAIIDNSVNASKESKIFFDDKVIIENDLNPGADKNKALRGDIDVAQYLRNFNTNYTKSAEPNINISVERVSTLKKASYFYYNVLFECDYAGTTVAGKKFEKFYRVAELMVVKETKWTCYIRAIRFPKDKSADFDNTNDFTNVIPSDGELERILKTMNDEKLAKKREEDRKIKGFIFEGDQAFEEKKFDLALNKYHEAFIINPGEKDTNEKIEKARKAIAEKKQKDAEEAERQRHIAQMKADAKKLKSEYSFKKAKVVCDSLILMFKVTEPDIVKLSDQMSKINASLSGVEISVESKKYSDAIDKCDDEIKKAKLKKDSLTIAEFNYQAAKIYYTTDIDNTNRILRYATDAISFSDERHQEALKIRADIYVRTEKLPNAIEDATRLVQNDSYNPDNYLFRAKIFETNKFPEKAIADYEQAILHKTTDKTAYLNKAKLEHNTQKFSEAIKTCTDGIANTQCYALLYYSRGMAYKESFNYFLAGKDFRDAIKCGLEEKEKKSVHAIATDLVAKGNVNLQKGLYPAAVTDFTNAVDVDSSQDALYLRAFIETKINKNEDAIKDLNALLKLNPKYPNGFTLRGIAYTNINEFTYASHDFQSEIFNTPKNDKAFYFKGQSELKQQHFADAVKSFETAASLAPSDTAHYYEAVAYYNLKNYELAISQIQFARKTNNKRWEFYYLSGKAYYDQGNYSSALKEFEAAKELIIRKDELEYQYGRTQEKLENFDEAAKAFGSVASDASIKDTALLRCAMCLIKTRETEKYTQAIFKLKQYLVQANKPDEAEIYATMAYARLMSNDGMTANSDIIEADKKDSNNAMLAFARACRSAIAANESETIDYLDKALASKRFTKKDVENEKCFRQFRKSDKFKAMMAKYFK